MFYMLSLGERREIVVSGLCLEANKQHRVVIHVMVHDSFEGLRGNLCNIYMEINVCLYVHYVSYCNSMMKKNGDDGVAGKVRKTQW